MEIWVPYGDVESLVTLMQENLSETIDPKPESHLDELVLQVAEKIKAANTVFILDSKPSTLKLVKAAMSSAPKEGKRFVAPNPRRVEASVPELKDSIEKVRPPGTQAEGQAEKTSPDLAEAGKKLAIYTGEPDPLFGFLDAPVALALACVSGSRRLGYRKRDGDAAQPLREGSPSYAAVRSQLDRVQETEYVTIITRGGEPYSLADGDSQARANYLTKEVPPAKGIVVGAGGRGYDDTLSQAVRLVLGSLKGVKKGGDIVIIAECREGLGSQAVQMFLSGRMTESFLTRGPYVDGLEEIPYFVELREKYNVTLLSSLPDLYAGGKLRFKTARGAGEALGKVFSSVGRGAKLNVVTRGCETVIP